MLDVDLIKKLKNGIIVWNPLTAKQIREFQKEHPDYIHIIDNIDDLEEILDVKFDGSKKLPYFSARLSKKGKSEMIN